MAGNVMFECITAPYASHFRGCVSGNKDPVFFGASDSRFTCSVKSGVLSGSAFGFTIACRNLVTEVVTAPAAQQ
jgi:hypothetical protein